MDEQRDYLESERLDNNDFCDSIEIEIINGSKVFKVSDYISDVSESFFKVINGHQLTIRSLKDKYHCSVLSSIGDKYLLGIYKSKEDAMIFGKWFISNFVG